MRNIIKLFLISGIATAILLSASCATLTQDINVEAHAQPHINFNAYKSYAWVGSAKILFDPVGQWEQPTLDTDEEVKFNINRELRSRGLYEAQVAPDLLVAFATGVNMADLALEEDPKSQQNMLANVPKAALVIALIDADSMYTVWLGFAEGEAQQQQPIENIRERIEYAVAEMFEHYNK